MRSGNEQLEIDLAGKYHAGVPIPHILRFGEHEMNSSPNKLHCHQETWHDDKVENVLQRIPK